MKVIGYMKLRLLNTAMQSLQRFDLSTFFLWLEKAFLMAIDRGVLLMPYVPIVVDRENLTIMGVKFPDLKTLEYTASAIGSNMFEGFEPTKKGLTIIRDYCLGIITFAQMVAAARNKSYE